MRSRQTIVAVAISLWVASPLGARFVLAGQQPPGQPQGDEARGKTVLAEARKALGGEDKLTAVQRLQVNGTTKRANGDFNLEGDTEVFIELPDKFRRNESLSIGSGGGAAIERKEVLNGNEIWNEVSGDLGGRFGRGRLGGGGGPGGAPPDAAGGGANAARGNLSPEDQERLREFQRRNLQSEVSRLLLALLLTSQTPVAWIGTAQSPDGTADVLEMKTSDGSATRLFVDSATRMPLMLTWTGPAGRGFGGRGGRRGQAPPDQAAAPAEGAGGTAAPAAPPAGGAQGAPGGAAQGRGRGPQGPPATLEMHLSEYKTVNGIKLPHLITRGASGATNEEWIIKSYKINPNFKSNTFTK
jgi:hypothetical protein